MNLIKLTHKNFDDVIAKHDLIVIDFGAQWCAPCRSFEKVISQVAEQYPDVMFGNVDIDAEKDLAQEFHILSVPSVMILRDRVIVFAESGAMTGTVLSKLIRQAQAIDPKTLKNVVDQEGG
ncbi:thioredoxin family protein [Candidiatus Paracoxiella cheracis]|uniref:thioredoxin family protein n=1 Tax=Candidiatus Paracoxiella cheracis TaxID=3405120 RepID=UPI003BF55BE8